MITRIKFPILNGYKLDSKDKSKILIQSVGDKNVKIKYHPTNKFNNAKVVEKYKYVGAAFQALYQAPSEGKQGDPRPNELGIDRLRIILSNDGLHWRTLHTNYPNLNVRDPSIKKIGQYWYVIYTNGLVRTRDFNQWENMNWNVQINKFGKEWAPEFVEDEYGGWHVIMCAEKTYEPHDTNFKLYITSFDPNTGVVGKNWQRIRGTEISSNALDPNMQYQEGKYYLWSKDEDQKTLHCVVSDSIDSGFNIELKNNLQNDQIFAYEAPEKLGRSLYFDTYNLQNFMYNGVNVAKSRHGKYGHPQKISGDFLIRHFSIVMQK